MQINIDVLPEIMHHVSTIACVVAMTVALVKIFKNDKKEEKKKK